MSAIDRVGLTATIYTRLRPQEVTHTGLDQAAERPVATSFGGAPAPSPPILQMYSGRFRENRPDTLMRRLCRTAGQARRKN
jgi:hypothetical protein